MWQKLWPTPYKIKKGSLSSFLIQLLIFILVCIVGGLLIGLLGKVLDAVLVGRILVSVAGALLEIYGIVGIVLCVLKFIGIAN